MSTSVRQLVLAALLMPTALVAQERQQRTGLAAAEWHLARGEFPEARTSLQRWRRENPSSRADEEQLARYFLLTGRLTTNADSAEDNYLTVAVNYPTTRYAADALLRLAQARHARGDESQAVTYLRRVIVDYPASDQRTSAAIWLVRIEAPRGASNALMCDLLRSVDRGSNPETIEHLKLETDRVCTGRNVAARTPPRRQPTTPVQTPAARNPPARAARSDTTSTSTAEKADSVARIVESMDTTPRPTPTPTTPAQVSPAGGRVSVQVGAFRDIEGARDVQSQLEGKGFADVRLVRVAGNNLIRVRIGRFVNRAGAAELLARLAAIDVSAVLVTDADKEQPVGN